MSEITVPEKENVPPLADSFDFKIKMMPNSALVLQSTKTGETFNTTFNDLENILRG